MPLLRACGARPSAGGPFRLGWPCGEKPGIPRRAVFSEGRGLRARTVRPDEWQGIALPPVPLREAGGQEGAILGFAQCLPSGRAEPAPPRNGQATGRRPYGGKPADDAKGGFLGGAHSVRPHCEAGRKRGHVILTNGSAKGPWPKGGSVVLAQCLPSGRAEPAPPGCGPSKLGWPCGGRPGDEAEGSFLGGARSPRPHGTAGRMARHCVATGAFTRSRWPRGGSPGFGAMPS